MIEEVLTVQGNAVAEFENKKIIAGGTSPFVDKSKFTIVGYGFVQLKFDNKALDSKKACPVFKVKFSGKNGAEPENLFISTLFKAKIDKDNNIVEPEGSFNTDFKKFIAKNKTLTDGELLKKAVAAYKDKQIETKRTTFVGLYKDGSQGIVTLLEFNFVENK